MDDQKRGLTLQQRTIPFPDLDQRRGAGRA